MKILLSFLFAISLAHADRKIGSTVPNETIQRLRKLYPNQTEAFILERLNNAPSAFDKWRSFPPYYYELLTRLDSAVIKKLNARQGLCAGDPHLENFGFIYDQKPLFTLNDLDDVALCSLNADLLRLLIGQRLVAQVSTTEFLKAYQEGMGGLNVQYPEALVKLEAESFKKKTQMSKKYKKLLEASSCDGDFAPLTSEELKLIKKFAASEKKEFVKACSRTKDSGGSAGSKRFIVFYQTAEGADVFELKPLAHPAPLFDKKLESHERELLFTQALSVYFNQNLRAHYYPVKLEGTLYQRRPVWGGNSEIKEDELSVKDMKEVMLYEARTLGRYHRITNTASVALTAPELEKLASEIEKKWKLEFGE